MPRFIFYILAIVFLLPKNAFACNCLWAGPFLTVAPKSDLVVKARVKEHIRDESGEVVAMEISISGALRGLVPGTSVRVWSGKQGSCQVAVAQFPVGTTWVLALEKSKEVPEPSVVYQVSGCGTYWLPVSNFENKEIVEGNLQNDQQRSSSEKMEYQKFVIKFSEKLH